MSERAEFPQILEYLDNFHKDVYKLAVLIDRLLDEKGFEYLPSATNSVGDVSSHFERPIRWRMRYIYRYYTPLGIERPDTSILFIIYLGLTSPFMFPAMLCSRLFHESLKESRIHRKIYRKSNLRPLLRGKSKWNNFREENGWSIAEPSFDTPITQIRGYILNTFDLTTRENVLNYVVTPLTTTNGDLDLNSVGDIRIYAFPELRAPADS